VTLGSALAGKLGGGVRVLTYHRFGASVRDPFSVTAREFERQMAFLARSARASSLSALLAHLEGTRPLPAGAVVVTIDDGDASVFDVAWPILRSYGIPAVVYPIVGSVGSRGFLTWSELERLRSEGVAVGSHSLTHVSMARVPREVAIHEMAESRRILVARLGEPVTSFAFPFGTRRDYDDRTSAMLSDAGYRCAFTSQHGRILAGDRFRLPRIKVEGGDPPWVFPWLCRGAMDAWGVVDRVSARLQKPHATDQGSTT
jgi:peptidoglycan/xylan/chitin deacetylase (PgdA/CDA1 family)